MVGEEELSSAIGATSGGTSHMNVLKENLQVGEELMLPKQRKRKHHPRR